MFVYGEIWVIFNKIILQHHFLNKSLLATVLTPSHLCPDLSLHCVRLWNKGALLHIYHTGAHKDTRTSFQILKMSSLRWADGRVETVLSLERKKLPPQSDDNYYFPQNVKKKTNSRRRGGKETKENIQIFAFLSLLLLLHPTSPLFSVSCLDLSDLSLSFLCIE